MPESEKARLTTCYGVVDGSLIPLDPAQNSIFLDAPAFPMGGSGLVSSPRDYDRFLRMIGGYGVIEGKRVMSEAAVRMGTSDLLPNPDVTKGTPVAGYGFGAGGRQGGPGRAQQLRLGRRGGHDRLRHHGKRASQRALHAIYAVERLSAECGVRAGGARRSGAFVGTRCMNCCGAVAFAGSELDRADHIRTDPERLAALKSPQASLLLLDGLAPELDDDNGLRWGRSRMRRRRPSWCSSG